MALSVITLVRGVLPGQRGGRDWLVVVYGEVVDPNGVEEEWFFGCFTLVPVVAAGSPNSQGIPTARCHSFGSMQGTGAVWAGVRASVVPP
ncbi:hypothetical protein [Streptomyces orinoci]|uniref:Uncharacterized protein n=1 Tax=Streptomyces orinoci TaxID=67339 RepID=A0ABV3JUW2_STRON|nr:hypothetical protein [Streptomyces orinoci]